YKFKSYREFLAIEYFNLAEVKLYCQDNRIKNMIEYKRHARSHARLKVHPNSIDGYKNAKDIFWEPTEYQPLIDVGLPVWADLVKCYCERLKYS
ncbi:hypothetical protein EA003_20015, partial [Vibrio anguillarum]|nr:hypothetical protein [Vibrio anguillarum]